MDQETAMLRPQTGQSDASNLATATDIELGARSHVFRFIRSEYFKTSVPLLRCRVLYRITGVN